MAGASGILGLRPMHASISDVIGQLIAPLPATTANYHVVQACNVWATACMPDADREARKVAAGGQLGERTSGGAMPALGMSLMNGGCAILKLPSPRSVSRAPMLGPYAVRSLHCMVLRSLMNFHLCILHA